MPILDELLRQGYTLPGAPRNVIQPDGTAGMDQGPLANLSQGIQTFIAKQQLADQERQKKLKNQADTYKTLRDAGYTPEKAHAAVISGNLPDDIPGLSTSDEVDQAKLTESAANVEKSKADTIKTIAETGKINAETSVVGDKKNTIESQIMNKLANNLPLNDGEQKIYNDVIKKKNNGGLAELLSQMDNAGVGVDTPAGTTKETVGDPQVAVTAPDGSQGYVPQSKLPLAIKKGYKKR